MSSRHDYLGIVPSEARQLRIPKDVVRSAVCCALLLAGCSEAGAPPISSTTSAPPVTIAARPTATTTTTEATTTTTSTVPLLTDLERCLRRADFGDPANSPYALPYPPGDGYTIIQSYCHDDGSHESQLAYDFLMPAGSTVVASRAGVVVEVKEDVPDNENSRFLNFVLIEHDDGTVAFYAHLQHEGALVEEGDVVAAGEPIALSGATGRTGGPVLHFGVYFSYPPIEGRDEPIVFNNAEGSLDVNGGLAEGSFYRAVE